MAQPRDEGVAGGGSTGTPCAGEGSMRGGSVGSGPGSGSGAACSRGSCPAPSTCRSSAAEVLARVREQSMSVSSPAWPRRA
jgi:hypothetical protein